MSNILKRKSVWISFIICLWLVLICIIVKLNPSNFIDECLEFISGSKTQTSSWAFLVAGSKGFDNYRHQADVAHAYQTLLKNGVPFDHIIVMMNDDVVNDTRNPILGKLFNHPNGSDVYQSLRVDYSGKNVNSANFLHILTGNKVAMQNLGSSRVIESNHKDNIFVNFVGHGSSGIIAFTDDYLNADELNSALQSMFDNHKFNKMLLYIESCRAGSLFDGILSETNNIFAITAAGPRESSWSVYCFEDYETLDLLCLGDEFSVTWIEDQENAGSFNLAEVNKLFKDRTVLNHFNSIRTTVKLSNVMPYGDFSVGMDKLSAYIGKSSRLLSMYHNNIQYSGKNNVTIMSSYNISESSIKIHKLKELDNEKKYTVDRRRTQDKNYKTMKQIVDRIFTEILHGVIKRFPGSISEDINELKKIPSNLPLYIFPCYRQTLDHIINKCFSLPKIIYSFDAVHIFSNLCKTILDSSEISYEEFDVVFKEVINNVCPKKIFSSTYNY